MPIALIRSFESSLVLNLGLLASSSFFSLVTEIGIGIEKPLFCFLLFDAVFFSIRRKVDAVGSVSNRRTRAQRQTSEFEEMKTMPKVSRVNVYFLLACTAICFLVLQFNLTHETELSRSAQKHIVHARACLTSELAGTTKTTYLQRVFQLHTLVEKCSGAYLNSLNFSLFMGEEEKWMVHPVASVDPCQIVTLGIGQNIDAEKKLKAAFPSCHFLGVDNDAEVSGVMYSKDLGGNYLNGLVGVRNGSYSASILHDGGYFAEMHPHWSFKELMRQEQISFIDNLLMDIEGAEFALFEDMINFPSDYPTVCQWNVEFHDPRAPEKGDQVIENLLFSVTNSPYLLVKADRLTTTYFNRCFLVNTENEECRAKYLAGNVPTQKRVE